MSSSDNMEIIPITPQKHDPAWKHCQMFRNGDKVQLKCVYCGKMFKGGGIHRIKEHLAGHKGNAATCLHVPTDVRLAMQHSLEVVVVKKRKKQKIAEEISNVSLVACEEGDEFGNHCDEDDVNVGAQLIVDSNLIEIEPSSSFLVNQEGACDNNSGEKEKRKKGRGKNSNANPNPNANAIVVSSNGLGGKNVNSHVQTAIGMFLYDIGAPLDAVNSVYFQRMVDAIALEGPGMMLPSYPDVRGWILKNSVEEVKSEINKLMVGWERTGCSVLVDQWNTEFGKILLSFLVYSSEGVVFLKSVDASAIINSPDALFELVKQVVEEVGPSNVVQVITNNEEQYVSAGKKLTSVFPNVYWTPCASHCIGLILEDFSKLEWISAIVDQARFVTRYVYNHSVVLNMMRMYTSGNDIVVPGPTRSATSFTTLKRMVDLKHNLQAMVTSQEWMDSPYSKKPGGLEMLDIVSNQSFWSSCVLIVQLTNPLLRVLRMVSSDSRPAMGFVYAETYRAKETIKRELVKREDYIVYWNIIDHWWEKLWLHPLHSAGFYLNPKFFYSIEEDMLSETMSGMLDCIEKLVHDSEVQDKIMKEISLYKNAVGDFGRKLAARARDTMLPVEWWSTYGGTCPNLSRLAIRILSQTCSSSGYKLRSIPFEQVHDTRNCLERQRLSDLVFVQYNMRLRQMGCKKEEHDITDPISLNGTSNVEDWITGKDVDLKDYGSSEWMALEPVSANTMIIGSLNDEAEELGPGFTDNEIFTRMKDGEDENIERKVGTL